MPDTLWNTLQSEAENSGQTTAEYVRSVLRSHVSGPDTQHDTQPNTQANTQPDTSLATRVDELEERVARLEAERERPGVDLQPAADETAGDVDAALSGWSHGRTDQEREASRTVARASLQWLRDAGTDVARRDVSLDELADQDPEGRNPDTIWKQVVRSAWSHAADRGYVDKPNSRRYRWVG
jgi:uncharacterized small protein (DUF1192 family)